MSKKELRKELELLLVKAMEDVLNKRNADSAKKIRKTTYEASKDVAKKFYKTIKPHKKAVAKPKPSPARSQPVKTAAKNKVVSRSKTAVTKRKK